MHMARPRPTVRLVLLVAFAVLVTLLAALPGTASAQAARCPGGAEPLAWEDDQQTMVCENGTRISLARSVSQRNEDSRCPEGERPLRWEDDATVMVCPDGRRIDFTEVASRTALANTGLPLELLVLFGAGTAGIGLLLLRRRGGPAPRR